MHTAVSFTENLIFLSLYIFILILSTKDKKRNGFVKNLIIITLSLRIFSFIAINILSQTFGIYRWYESEVIRTVSQFISSISFFLLLYCYSFFFGDFNDKQTGNIKKVDIKKRKIWLSFLLFLITAGIYVPFWLYRTVKDLKSNFEEIPYTPGQAVGYLFIPFFNIYWLIRLIISLPRVVAGIEKKYYAPEYGFYMHPVLISLLWFFLVILSYIKQASFGFDEGPFLMFITAGIFPYISLCVIFLTLQAKINSFADVQQKG